MMKMRAEIPTFRQYLDEGYQDWIKAAVLGTLMGMSQACITSPDSPECSIEQSYYVNPWFEYKHQWLGSAKPKEDYPLALIEHIKSIIGQPPDPRAYEQTSQGRLQWHSDLKLWYKKIKDNVNLGEWYRKYSA